jgi:putative hydrolase of the HAD superfamily
MAIKVITIDFWNTLFDSKNGYERNQYRNKILKDHFEELGFSFTDEDYDNAMKDSWEYFSEIWQREMRTPMSGELVEYYFKKMNVTADLERIDSIAYIFEESILKYKPDLIKGVKENLDILRDKYKLAIISDTGFSPGKDRFLHSQVVCLIFKKGTNQLY